MYASTARFIRVATTGPRPIATVTRDAPHAHAIHRQYLHQTSISQSSSTSSSSISSQHARDGGPNPSKTNPETIPGPLGAANAQGKPGGSKKLDSSSDNAPPKPKVSNLSVPGVDKADSLTEEQKEEVAEHNRQFEETHDGVEQAPEDKVDKKFWTGGEENPKSGTK